MQSKRKKVSHYLLEEQLNKGSFGTVYRGRDMSNNEPRAIKVIANLSLTTPRQRQALQREIQIMLNLQHEHIVKLYDHMETSNSTYLVLELCNNGDLSQFKSGISEERAVVYIRQLISALKVLHQNNIIHRDLKPANIFLASESKIKLGDFGLARTLGMGILAETYVGSPFYMSPEVLQVRNHTSERYDFRADIWSLGCILYELILGKRPFHAKEIEDLMPDINFTLGKNGFLNEEGISEMCRDFLRRIFKMNPDERMSFEEMCQHPLILGRQSVVGIVDLSGVQCLNEDLTVLTAEDALDLAQAIRYSAECSKHPFLLYMKACISLKPYLNNEKCEKELKILFGLAQNCIHKTDWENSTVARVLLETVIHMCRGDERLPLAKLRENFKNAYILLKSIKPSPYLMSLKNALKRQYCV